MFDTHFMFCSIVVDIADAFNTLTSDIKYIPMECVSSNTNCQEEMMAINGLPKVALI
jgi:hypothetical protein